MLGRLRGSIASACWLMVDWSANDGGVCLKMEYMDSEWTDVWNLSVVGRLGLVGGPFGEEQVGSYDEDVCQGRSRAFGLDGMWLVFAFPSWIAFGLGGLVSPYCISILSPLARCTRYLSPCPGTRSQTSEAEAIVNLPERARSVSQ